jgi:AbrB family looped-hinge helix DNA binding protein
MTEVESMTKKTRKRIRVTDRGQVTIPKEMRDATGIAAPGDVIVRRRDSGAVLIEPVPTVEDLHGCLQNDTGAVDENVDAILAESRHADTNATERLVDENG